MVPAPHPSATRKFQPPRDWDPEVNGPCATLEVADLVDGGAPFMESIWRPDARELAALKAGGSIVLGIQGQVHTVVYVAVTAPPKPEPEARR